MHVLFIFFFFCSNNSNDKARRQNAKTMIVAINDGVTNGTSNFPDWWTYILNGCTIIRSQFDIGFAVQLIWESLWGGGLIWSTISTVLIWKKKSITKRSYRIKFDNKLNVTRTIALFDKIHALFFFFFLCLSKDVQGEAMKYKKPAIHWTLIGVYDL